MRTNEQNEINTIAGWTDEHGTPLSVDKCSVLHCEPHQPNHEYHNNSTRISSVDSVRDLGVKRTTDSTYSGHCNGVIAKANSTCGALRRIFKSGHRSLLWPAFVSYVLPVLSQCSSVWYPYLKSDIAALESVQRNFMRRIRGLEQLSYNVRLAALTLESRRHLTDMTTVYKFLHGLVNCQASDAGLQLTATLTRGGGVHLVQQRSRTRVCANLFPLRAVIAWNKTDLAILNSPTLKIFKTALPRQFALQQTLAVNA